MKASTLVFGSALKYRFQIGVAIVSMIGLVALQLVVPWSVRELLGAVRTQADSGVLTQLGLLLMAVYVGRVGLQFSNRYFSHVAGWNVVSDVRHRLYVHLQRLSLRFHEDQATGALMSRVINDSNMFEALISHAVPDTLVNVLRLIGVAIVLSAINVKLLLLTLVPVPFIVWTMRSMALRMRPAFRERQKELADLNATLNDNLSGIREIKAFTREDSEASRVEGHIVRYRDSMLQTLRLNAFFGPLVDFAASMGTVIVVYFGGQLAFGGVLQVEDLVAFFLYLEMFYQPVRALTGAWEQTQEAMAGADRIANLLEEETETQDGAGAHPFPGRAMGEITFRKLSFEYIKGLPVLKDIDLIIPRHSHVALVGPTGAGKTTMASLIPRFYDATKGEMLIDGEPVRQFTLEGLRTQVSLVLQDVFLFNGTARDNILFACPEATEQRLYEVSKSANAHAFIADLPDGYDTIIGERGVKLSGGQKQRISIARALLKDAPILILDEATSSVDTETEDLIQQALRRLMKGRTTITIAHRLSTVRHADLIVVLVGGRIIEQGTHEQLIAGNGHYRRLTQTQSLITNTFG
ncbi:MAG: ABC transporter ATP-binding protein [Desulfobacterales bacterium]